jgi:hypothetical protein
VLDYEPLPHDLSSAERADGRIIRGTTWVPVVLAFVAGLAWVGPIAHLRIPHYYGLKPYCTTVEGGALR